MTLKHVAEYLSLNERTVLKLVQEGTIPGVKILEILETAAGSEALSEGPPEELAGRC